MGLVGGLLSVCVPGFDWVRRVHGEVVVVEDGARYPR
jgi:hypothetical protein